MTNTMVKTLSRLLLTTFALSALPLTALADRTTPVPQEYKADQYSGSESEKSFVSVLTALDAKTLRGTQLATWGELRLSCGASDVLIALSAVVDTLPIVPGFTSIIAASAIDDPNDASMTNDDFMEEMAGGALMSVIDTVKAPFSYLAHGHFNNPYGATKNAYFATRTLVPTLRSRDSACRKAIDELKDIKAEYKRRAALAKAEKAGKADESRAASKNASTAADPDMPTVQQISAGSFVPVN